MTSELRTSITAQDVTDTVDFALEVSRWDQIRTVRKPYLLSDNGFSYVSTELAEWLSAQNMEHVPGK